MQNSFFQHLLDANQIRRRLLEIDSGFIGFYSIGLYPLSLAYNCVMQTKSLKLLLATRPNRELFGALSDSDLARMSPNHIETIESLAFHTKNSSSLPNTLTYLIEKCELVVLSANSNHIEKDLVEAKEIRKKLGRENVVLACLAGSFCHDDNSHDSYILCEKEPNIAFFSGFHRHGALCNPLDSFTANFTHPDALSALLGAKMLDKLSPNIQVSSGIHNLEGQYIKAVKNMSSIFAGFAYSYHSDKPALLTTLLTLLLDQCLDQAASVSMLRSDRKKIYSEQPFPLTELGYGVQKIEASLVKDGDYELVRDHTFSQLTAMVADVKGSLMLPINGKPTRNFQAGQVLAKFVADNKRCPLDIDEFTNECIDAGLTSGGLEGLKSLRFWPDISKKYQIPLHDCSMINLLYITIYGKNQIKQNTYNVLTDSRELTNFCQESVRPTHSRIYSEALDNLDKSESMDLLIGAVQSINSLQFTERKDPYLSTNNISSPVFPAYIKAMSYIENIFQESI